MSYDLYFRKKNKEDFTLEEFNDYFKNRSHYKTENGQAFYENEDTGVYFIMEYNDLSKSLDSSGTPIDYSPANLNLNFLRPHIFALEAEPEVRAFVEHFDFLIFDPQDNGNQTDQYNTEAFISGYNAGNKFSYGAILKNNPEITSFVVPSKEIERCWQWNLYKDKLQNKLGEDIFIPQISFHFLNNEVKSMIVWGDGIPTGFPEVDTVIVFRQSLAPRKGFFSKKQNDITIVEYSKVLPLLGDKNSDGIRELLSEEKAQEWVKALPPSDTKPVPIPIDQVLDKELMP